MNNKIDFIKPNERIIYLILIVALVIALITISTCNKRTLDENYFVKGQVELLNGDMKELEGKLDENNSAIKIKAQELIQKKNEIQALILKGEISASEAQRRIRELRAQLSEVNNELILQKQVGISNSDSFGNIITSLRTEKNSLLRQVQNLNDELSRKPLANNIQTEIVEELGIVPLAGTKITKNSINIECELFKTATKDEFIYVEILDESGNNANPQKQNPSFTIQKGSKSFSGSVLSSGQNVFKPGKQYTLVFRDSKYIERRRKNVTVPKLIFGKGVSE